MGTLKVLSLLLIGFNILLLSDAFPGTRMVKWTLYNDRGMTWNEASKFCRDKGGHLPMTNTHIAVRAFNKFVEKWKNNTLTSGTWGIWIGLFTPHFACTPFHWEGDCSILRRDVQPWGYNESMEDGQCVRLNIYKQKWKTAECNRNEYVVCEKRKGNCTYQEHKHVSITIEPDASKGDVHENSTCWSLCLGLLMNGTECEAAVLDEETAICKLYLEGTYPRYSGTQGPSKTSTLMLRHCFEGSDDESVLDNVPTDSQKLPQVNCHYSSSDLVGLADVLPFGVQKGLVTSPMPVSPSGGGSASVSEESEKTSTTQGSVATSATQESEETSTTQGSGVTSITQGSEATSTTQGSGATSTIQESEETSATQGSGATSTTQGSGATSTTQESEETSTTQGSGATSATQGSGATSTRQKSEETSTTQGSGATSATQGSGASSTSKTAQDTTAPEHLTAQASTASKQKLCPCSCAFAASTKNAHNQKPTNTTKPSGRIPTNSTSKHRRSKTSAVMAGASYPAIGSTCIVGIFSALGLVVLCDLHRFYTRRRGRRVSPKA